MPEYQRPYGVKTVTGGVRLYLTYQPDFIAWLKATVGPFSRGYDDTDKSWYVGSAYASEVIAKARTSFASFKLLERVRPESQYQQPFWVGQGYRSFFEWQQAQQGASAGPSSVVPDTDHAMLCVTTAAPPEVIRAAYKALALLYHPDKPTGNHSKMQAVNAAYDRLKKAGKA